MQPTSVQPSSVSLLLAAALFLVVLLWRVRPAMGPAALVPWGTKRRAARVALRDAKARIESAQDEASRAAALCDAADLMAGRLGRRGSATALYLRALRADPRSVPIVERAVAGLAKRPRALESLLWRHLALAPWVTDTGIPAEAGRKSLEALRSLYEGPLNNTSRAKALEHALKIFGGGT